MILSSVVDSIQFTMLQLTDITTIQGKSFEDLVAFAAASLKPKNVFLAGANGKTVRNILEYGRDSESKVHRETREEEYDRPDGKGGFIPMKVSFTDKTFERNFQGKPLVENLFFTELGAQKGEIETALKSFDGERKVEFMVGDIAKQLVERATGEGTEVGFVVDLESMEFDLITMDARKYTEDVAALISNGLDMFFSGIAIVTGIKGQEHLIWNLMQKYGGSCVIVLSSIEDGTVILFREEILL